ncbi:MAG TPA: hypothetical protein VNO55_20365 [Polyangia bacterium]|nr:hypothetical protein [Polyangia bacterium]
MAGSPQRPADVPAAAAWIDAAQEWQLEPTGDDGRKQGLLRTWRADGSLRAETPFDNDQPHGVARLFHPDGSLAREMRYEAGLLTGPMVAHGSEHPAAEPMQACCVPPGAWRMQIDYDRGTFLHQRWFDRAGVHILPSGKPFPQRPASVSADAHFEEQGDRWISGTYSDNAEMQGVWQRWSRDGVLLERDEYQSGRPNGLWQRFLPTGALQEESHFRDGQRSGPYRQTHLNVGAYANRRISEERGFFERDQAVGEWTLHDDEGVEVRRLQLGVAVSAESLAASPVFALNPPTTAGGDDSAQQWLALADALENEGRLGEAVVATARAAAQARSADELRLRVSSRQLPLTGQASAELAVQLMKAADGKLPLLVNGLVRGGDAAQLLRAIAAARDGADTVSLDLVEAALLLDPAMYEGKVTRALLQLHRGHPMAARLDAESLPPAWQEQRDFLLGYGRVLFPVFDFWPARSPVEKIFSEVPDRPDQDIDAVRAVAQKFATRLMNIRQAVAELLRKDGQGQHKRPWLLPDLSPLLPAGPVPLETWDFEEIVVDDEADPAAGAAQAAPQAQPTLVKVAEELPLDFGSLPSLLRLARREWNSLCWLCWSAGLDRVALPTTLAPPELFGQAAGMTVQRLWRCRDKLSTAGLRAMTQGIPGFDWEGMNIDSMPPALVEIATLEYLEQRALFFWLCDSGVQSPWQDNLRGDG